MYARVVRFTDVSADRVAAIGERIKEAGGPPEGVKSTGIKLLYDADQGTAVFVGFFASAQDMRDSAAVLEAMDSADTPGTRASIDTCQVSVEADA